MTLCLHQFKMADKKRVNFTIKEKTLLCEIVAKYSSVLENKKSDAVSALAKKIKWEEVANEYNAANGENSRTADQLKKCVGNLKCLRKKELIEKKKQRLATGGGIYPGPSLPVNFPQLEVAHRIKIENCSGSDSDTVASMKSAASDSFNISDHKVLVEVTPDQLSHGENDDRGRNTDISNNQNPVRRTGNNQMIGLNGAEIPGGPVGMVRQPPPQNTATSLLQTLNNRPPAQMMNIQGMPNKLPMGVGIGGNPQGPMGQMPVPSQLQSLNSQMHNPMGNQLNSQMVGAQMNMPMGSQIHAQLNHMAQRKPGEMLLGNQPGTFLGPRSAPPNQFLRQSPSPSSAVSPVGMGSVGSNQMAVSPAMAPSPSSQLAPVISGPPRSNGMASSPSSSLNTPGQAVPTPSPGNMLEEQQYREKVRQLSKYIEPLRRMIARMGNDDVEKLSKMKKLLEILSNPNKRMPLDTLRKCEVVLEKLDLKRGEGGPHSGPMAALKEIHNSNPLLEAVSNCLQSSVNNHTLQRTFGPTLEALFGPEIKNMPPPLDPKPLDEGKNDVPEVLQGEIARLDQRFKVSLDNTQQFGSKAVRLVCWLDDKYLPCVPPISISIPEDYPKHPPRCIMSQEDYASTDFLTAVHRALSLRIRKLPSRFSLSQLLDTWEMSVRQASAPVPKPASTMSVLMSV